MELLHVFFSAFLFVLLMGISQAEISSPEGYWNLVLPTTPIPKSIKFLLYTGKHRKTTKYNPNRRGPRFKIYSSSDEQIHYNPNAKVSAKIYSSNDDQVHYNPNAKVSAKIYSSNDDQVHYNPNAKVSAKTYSSKDDEIQYNPNVTIFFLEKDLRTGKKMNLQFTYTNDATFLPRQIADSIPFSPNKLAEILNQFSVKPESEEANIIKRTIELCQAPGIKGEEKYCPTSLESMIDFTTSKLGTRLNAASTEVDSKRSEREVDEYAITRVQQVAEKVTVACHKLNYVYAVFYCHKTDKVRTYSVALRSTGKLGDQLVKTVAVCHKDTSGWNPKHLAFHELKVKPGTVPICHFLSKDAIIWIPY